MKLLINGTEQEIKQEVSLQQLMEKLNIDYQQGGIALALNNEVVQRDKWDHICVSDNDRIEIIQAVQGG